MEELFAFQRFLEDEDETFVARCQRAAIDKLQTLYPERRLTVYDRLTLGIETDS